MEVTKLVRRGDEGSSVNQDAESWSRLESGICDLILEKLPFSERLRLRVVCKDWKRSALKRVERKPYFVIILESTIRSRYVNGLVVYDVDSKSVSFEPLPSWLPLTSPYQLTPFAVEGLIFSTSRMGVAKKQWCVYNIHNRAKHVLPHQSPGSRLTYFCGMMVDTSIKPYTFKLVACNRAGEEMQIYDSSSRSWSIHPSPNSENSNSSLLGTKTGVLCLCMCHKGCMYISTEKAREGVLVYSMEDDRWSTLSGAPFRGKKRPYMGAWDDRIFAVLHDAGAKSVSVWELIDASQQVWVEYACCSQAQYEQLMKHDRFVEFDGCQCEIVSVFSEEYVLMYNWHAGLSNALVLLNLKTREWEPVASIPNMIEEVYEEEGFVHSQYYSGRSCLFEHRLFSTIDSTILIRYLHVRASVVSQTGPSNIHYEFIFKLCCYI